MDVVPELPKVKHDFASIVESISLHAWTMSQFVIWLDLKLSEYKVTGYMVLDQSCGSLPDWLANIDADNYDRDRTTDQNQDVQYTTPPERRSLGDAQHVERSDQQPIRIPDEDDDRMIQSKSYLESNDTRQRYSGEQLKRVSKHQLDRDMGTSNKQQKIVHDLFRKHPNLASKVPPTHLDSNRDSRLWTSQTELRRSSASQSFSPSHTITQRTSSVHQQPRDGLSISRDPFPIREVANNSTLESWTHSKSGSEASVESRRYKGRLMGIDVPSSHISSNVTNSQNLSSAENVNRQQSGSEGSYESSGNDGDSMLIVPPSSRPELDDSIIIKEEEPDIQISEDADFSRASAIQFPQENFTRRQQRTVITHESGSRLGSSHESSSGTAIRLAPSYPVQVKDWEDLLTYQRAENPIGDVTPNLNPAESSDPYVPILMEFPEILVDKSKFCLLLTSCTVSKEPALSLVRGLLDILYSREELVSSCGMGIKRNDNADGKEPLDQKRLQALNVYTRAYCHSLNLETPETKRINRAITNKLSYLRFQQRSEIKFGTRPNEQS